MIIDIHSWHYRWYAYWLKEGRGTTPSYQENLCHYVRVLLFWAPVTWIDQHTTWDWGKLSERATLALLFLFIVGACGYALIVAAVTQTTKFLLGVGSFGALVGCLGLVVLSVKTLQGKQLEVPGTVKLAGAYVLAKKRRVCPFITFGGAEDAHTS